MESATELSPNDREVAIPAYKARSRSRLLSGFGDFVAVEKRAAEDAFEHGDRPADASEGQDADCRRKILKDIANLLERHREPMTQFELIAMVERHIADRCDSRSLIEADRLWLEFEKRASARFENPAKQPHPLTLTEFVTIAREVVQQGGRSKKAIARFNAYVDVDMVLSNRAGPAPSSAAELVELIGAGRGSVGYRRRIQEIWLDYELACRALKDWRSKGGPRDLRI